MAIEDRLARRGPEDLLYIGGLIEELLDSETGRVIQALLNGRIAIEAGIKANLNIPAERRLGRIEMCQMLLEDFEQFIQDRHKLIVEMKRVRPQEETVMQDGPTY